jgi:hypothetical protein
MSTRFDPIFRAAKQGAPCKALKVREARLLSKVLTALAKLLPSDVLSRHKLIAEAIGGAIGLEPSRFSASKKHEAVRLLR